jgi:hypothetical protein
MIENKKSGIRFFYFPFGLGELLPLPPTEGLPVVLGVLLGLRPFIFKKKLTRFDSSIFLQFF